MGPKILQKQGKETVYTLRCLPIGGYCAMEGEDEDTGNPRAFAAKPWWRRLIILAAGVGAVWLFRRQPGDLARALTCACAVLAAACPGATGQAAGVAALAGIGRAAERGELLMHGAEASAAQTARTVRRCGWLLLAYHAVCLPLAACGVIGPAAAAVLACGASGGVLLYALRGNGTKGERP